MYDLKELTRYVEVTDKGIKFPHDEPRKIRLEVLAEKETDLFVKDGKDSPVYIGTFRGYDIVQFNVRGPTTLQATGPGVRVYTPEFQSEIIEIPEAVSFTRTMTRRQRNPEIEAIGQMMQRNMEKRLRQVERDVTLRVSQELRERHAENERQRFERASEEEARRVAESVASDDDPEANEAGTGDDPGESSGNVSGSRGQAKGQKLAAKPAAQGQGKVR